jgi:Predicted acyltransferases
VRIWELLAGSIIAYLNINSIKYNNKITTYFPVFGLILILFSIFFLNDEMSLPSIYSMPAIIGTCLIIFFGNSNNFLTKFLSLKVLVFFGLISYSLYLWHFPLFAFYNYIFFENNSFLIKIFIILLSIILSILSYLFIEKPFRNKKIIDNKKLFISLGISFLIILSSSLILLEMNKNNQKGIYEKVNIDSQIYFDEVNTKLNEIILTNSYEKKNIYKKNILIIGNSHAMDMFLMFKTNSDLFKNYNFELSGFDFLINELFEKDYKR